MCNFERFKILENTINDLQQSDFVEVLKYFPSKDILNINIMDYKMIRTITNFLKKISMRDIFYKHTEAVQYCWEFTLINLLALKNVLVDDIPLNLLALLRCLVAKMKALNEFTSFLCKERERLFNILSSAAKLHIFKKNHASVCTDIINDLMDMGGILPPNASKEMAEIAQVYIKLNAARELLIFCNISLNKFTLSTEFSNICIQWLLENGSSFLLEDTEDNNILCLLKTLVELYHTYNSIRNTENDQESHVLRSFESFISHLKQVSHRVILLSGKPFLRHESLRLFSLLISECHSEEMYANEEYTTVFGKLQLFPDDVNEWPCVKSEMFFYICSFLCTHSSLPWSSLAIIESISTLIYSFERFSMNRALLRSLCYIYPIVMIDTPNKKSLLLGDELLLIVSKFPYSFPKIITFHPAQLVWMLAMGCSYVRKQILVEWLKRDEDLDVLARAIMHCKATDVLLDVITDWKFKEVADKAAKMCHRLQDRELSQTIATMIPVALEDKILLGKLILSNPGMPDERGMALKICEFMSLILCFINDVTVLRAACIYSKYLVTGLKAETDIVNVFCSDMRNIKFLAVKVQDVDEETAMEILRLLKVLVLVQKRNHSMLDNQIEADLSRSLVGSEDKIDKSLDLLNVIVTSRDVFIQLEKSNIRDVFTTLFNVSRNSRFAARSFACLTGILRTNRWLACVHSTNIFIEIQCSLAVDEGSGPEFLMFLTIWMKILRDSAHNNGFYLPDKRVIANYIRRSGFIAQTREMYLLKLLNRIKIFPDH